MWCPACGSTIMSDVRVTRGTVSETTTVRRAPAIAASSTAQTREPVRLDEIRVDGRGVIIARLTEDVVGGADD
jgi:uncharacterized OB-fold protein